MGTGYGLYTSTVCTEYTVGTGRGAYRVRFVEGTVGTGYCAYRVR